jgi:DNA-binding response OmpR family regulator
MRASLILLVEDDDSLRRRYAFALACAGFVVLEARSGYEALQRIERRRPDLVILDSTLPGIDSDPSPRRTGEQPGHIDPVTRT